MSCHVIIISVYVRHPDYRNKPSKTPTQQKKKIMVSRITQKKKDKENLREDDG